MSIQYTAPDSNPQPFKLHPSPITTRPGRLPFNVLLWGRGRANKMFCASTQIKSSQLHPQVLMEPSEMKFKSFPTRWRQFKTFDPSCYSKMKTAATAPTTATALFESPLICLSTSTLSWVVAGSWLRQHFWSQRSPPLMTFEIYDQSYQHYTIVNYNASIIL